VTVTQLIATPRESSYSAVNYSCGFAPGGRQVAVTFTDDIAIGNVKKLCRKVAEDVIGEAGRVFQPTAAIPLLLSQYSLNTRHNALLPWSLNG